MLLLLRYILYRQVGESLNKQNVKTRNGRLNHIQKNIGGENMAKQIVKEVKPSLFADDMICRENP